MIWSKSRLKCFRECGYRYKLKYIDKIETKIIHEDLMKGIRLHELFDKFYLNYKGDISVAVEETREQLGLTHDFIKKYEIHVNNFKDWNNKKMAKYGVEQFQPLVRESKIENGDWTGVVDRVDKINGKNILIDYKTSNGNSLESYFDELCLYAWLFEQKYNEQIDFISIFFTGNNSFVVMKLDRKEFIDMLSDLTSEKDTYEKAIENEKLPIKPGFYCRWCPYLLTKHCTKEMREEK